MKKRFIPVILALVCLLILSACSCKHETWKDADCVNPKTCADCGETEGTPLGHSWLAATCETAKTCEVCSLTEGDALGHSWADATCETPKTCEVCSLVDGEALGHSWLDATTEAPKTCEACSLTEGERIITDERFTTAATADLHGTWVCQISADGDALDMAGLDATLECELTMVFGNDGSMSMHFSILNEEEFKRVVLSYLIDTLYAELEAGGYSKEEADDAFQQVYGMNVEEYAAYALNSISFNDLYSAINMNGVYYVADGMIYEGISWGATMEGTKYTLEGDTLTLHEDISGVGSETTVFTRVTE